MQLTKTLLKHYLVCERFRLSQADFHWQYFVCDSEDNSHDPKLITSVFCFVFHTWLFPYVICNAIEADSLDLNSLLYMQIKKSLGQTDAMFRLFF